MQRYNIIIIYLLSIITGITFANEVDVSMYMVSKYGKTGRNIGTVNFKDTQYGLLITPNLTRLPAGLHGFHVHVEPSCANRGMAAKGHLDPVKHDQHQGPYEANSHLGDLPVLYVNKRRQANVPTLAPRLTVQQIKNHALMIHRGGDNYSDYPVALGGGGARLACGVIK